MAVRALESASRGRQGILASELGARTDTANARRNEDRMLRSLLRHGVSARSTELDDASGGRERTIRIRYFEAGEGNDQTLLLLHGSGTSDAIASWGPNIPGLLEKFHIIAPDLPGYGGRNGSEKNHGRSTLGYYINGFLPQFLERTGVGGRLDIAGYSLGGGIALGFALSNPSAVANLVLVDAYGLLPSDREDARRFTLVQRLPFMVPQLSPTVGKILSMSRTLVRWGIAHAERAEEDISESMILRAQQNLRYGFPRAFYEAMHDEIRKDGFATNYMNRLHELDAAGVGAFFIHGQRDMLLPPSASEEASRRIAGAWLWMPDGCGHGPHLDKPKEFNDLVLAFLSRRDDAILNSSKMPFGSLIRPA